MQAQLQNSLQNIHRIMNFNTCELQEYTDSASKCCKNGSCLYCSRLTHMLEGAQEKYKRLLSQNYVGELTIHYLKIKNKELLHKISKNQYKTNHANNIQRQQLQIGMLQLQPIQNSPTHHNQPFLQTFNPAQLKKILSQQQPITNTQQHTLSPQSPTKLSNKPQPVSPSLKNTNSKVLSTKENSILGQPVEKPVKKQFNLSQLKMKAQIRLRSKMGDAESQNWDDRLQFRFY